MSQTLLREIRASCFLEAVGMEHHIDRIADGGYNGSDKDKTIVKFLAQLVKAETYCLASKWEKTNGR